MAAATLASMFRLASASCSAVSGGKPAHGLSSGTSGTSSGTCGGGALVVGCGGGILGGGAGGGAVGIGVAGVGGVVVVVVGATRTRIPDPKASLLLCPHHR